MQINRNAGFVRNIFLATSAAIVSTGCLMSEEESDTGADVPTSVEVSGSVGDGPVASASISVLSNNLNVLAELIGSADATYNASVQAPSGNYPLIIEARDGLDLVTNMAPDFTLKGALVEPVADAVANVNPFTTFAYELAVELPGGVGKENLALAEAMVVTYLNCGLSTLASSGPMATPIDESNVAEIVRASEALGETVRRTRDILNMFNFPGTGDGIVGALSSDLSDSFIDGRGGSRADSRTAAVATIASTLVQLEAISNELHVNGTDATASMNAAITQVSTSTPSRMVDELFATADMLTSIRTGLGAATQISTNPKVVELLQAANGLQSGMDHTMVRALLPDDYRITLQNVLLAVGGGDDSVIDTINTYVRDGGATSNSPPSISGDAPTEVSTNTAYDFLPLVSDPDLGDTLTFSIAGKPSWANFNTNSGRLNGTPADSDIGVYPNIEIAVSDGMNSASLRPFSINVQATSLGSVTLSWTAPSENEDGTPLMDLGGYRIYWGTVPGSYPNSATINNPGLTIYVVENLAPGTYNFVATSFNTSGVESDFSNPVTKIVP